MKRKWRWPAAGIVGLIVAVSLFVIPALGEDTITSDVGTLRLHMANDGDRLVYDPVAAGPNLTQTLTQSSCKLSSSGASLVAFSASSSNASKKPFHGLKDHRIGVGQNGEGNGEPCARINGDLGQKLTLSLTGSLAEESIGYAEIDLGFKFNGDAVLELRNGGTTGTLVDTVDVPCSGLSDCGPDSGGTDNERVILWLDPADDPGPGDWQAFQIAGTFDTIVIMPGASSANGVVSLEAGFNGSPAGKVGAELGTVDTLFTLVEAFDGEIDCTETEVLVEGETASMQVTRGFDTNGGCKGPPDGLLFTFDSGTEGDELFVDFITEPVDSDPDTIAQFLELITWNFEDPPNVPGEDQNKTLSYDDHVGSGKRVMPWCLADPRDENGDLPVGTSGDPVDTDAYLPSGHTSCLIETTSHVTILGDFVKKDLVYNVGDGKRWS
jgi:hypothetical protein